MLRKLRWQPKQGAFSLNLLIAGGASFRWRHTTCCAEFTRKNRGNLRAGFVATGAFRRQNRLKFSRSSLERPPELPRKETYLRARVEELCIGPHPRVQELCTGPDAGAPALKVWRLVAFRAEAANAYSSFLESCGCVASTFQGGAASVPSHFLLVMGPEMISRTARRPSL